MRREGEGVPQDYNEAVRWFRKAADQGLADAQFNLGIMYFHGEGIAQDLNEAVRWIRKASDQGFANAQVNLGALYYAGKGVTQDLKKALVLVSAGEANSDVKVAHKLRKEIEAALRLTPSEYSGPEAPSPSKCRCCGRGADSIAKLKPCPRCKGPVYCGKDCQSEHWKKGHKKRCTTKNT